MARIGLKRLFPLAFLLAAVSCASIGNPGGGPRDEDPPRFVRANPAPGSINVKKEKIEIEFDELVNVKDAFSKVVVSPYSASVPRVSSLGRKVTVQFTDSLLPNTTYSIDFANAIEDNNEGNKLRGFTYSFSTGPQIDTLQISGMVLSAQALEPQQGMLVGVYSNLADSAFSKLPLERFAKTDDRGRFTIRGLAPGTYRVFAVADVDNDYRHANPEEAMAFIDYTVSPHSERIETSDTIRNLITGETDTVLSRMRTRFLPNDLLLRSFEPDRKPQYLQKYERVDSTRLRLIFNAPSDSLPRLEIVSHPGYDNWAILERSQHNDTLTYWLRPESLVKTDSLYVGVTYLRQDTAANLVSATDTLRFFTERPRVKKKKEKRKKEEQADSVAPRPLPLGFSVASTSPQEVYLPLHIESATPLAHLDTTAVRLEQLVDTLWKPVEKTWKLQPLDSIHIRQFKIEYPWDYGKEYRLTADTIAATGIYGAVSDPLEYKFKTKSEEDYAALSFTVTGFNDSVPAFVELLSSSDTPVRRLPLVNGKVEFRHLDPGKYYARIFEDFNGDGIFTNGDFEPFIQPDAAYYYPKVVNLKKNWEKSETWDVFSTAVDLMKPEAIKKNKPENTKKDRRKNESSNGQNDEEEEFFDPTRNPFDPNDKGRRSYR